MASHDGGTGRWLRYGCLGCAGVLLLILGSVTILVSLGRGAVESQKIRTHTVEEPLPAVSLVPEAGSSPEGGAAALASDTPSLAVPDFTPGDDTRARPGRVLVDLSHGEFHVEPAPPGQPLRVEAEYDENRFELVTTLDQGAGGEWSYEIVFRQAGSMNALLVLARLMGARNPRVTVYLPRDVPMNLDLRFSQGGGEVDLGGLWLTETRVAFAQGGGDLEFSEPLRQPTEQLAIDASMGGGAFRRLGNASPKTLKVATQMGGGAVDLRGEWLRDCDVTLESRMGGLEVRLPDDVITRGLPRDRAGPEGVEDGSVPTLTFSYSNSMGEIEFVE